MDLKNKNRRKNKGRNVFIYSLACERRNIDAQKISSYLLKNNYNIVYDPKEADYTIFMTCGFIKSMSDMALEEIKKLKKHDSELIIAGCVPDILGAEFDKVFTGKIIPTKDMSKIDEIFTDATVKFRDLYDEHSMWKNFNKRTLLGTVDRIRRRVEFIKKINMFLLDKILKKVLGEKFHRTFPFNRIIPEFGNYCIPISRGCIHNCTYCAIRKAVGPLKSKPVDQILKEFKLGLKEGYNNFILEADDIGHYGIDIKSSLPELLEEITNIEGKYTIELKNCHPMWIIKYVDDLEVILQKKKIKSILLSIQSGNNRILKLMGRPYKKEPLVDTILRLKKAHPDLEIGVHLMIGFPTEQKEEFQETLELFDRTPFDFGNILSFSPQEGTKAILMKPQITEREKKRRIKHSLKFLRRENYFAWRSASNKNISFYIK